MSESIASLGAGPQQLALLDSLARDGLVAGRVLSQVGPDLIIGTGSLTLHARVSRGLRRASGSAEQRPVVGDFVGVTPGGGDGHGRIDAVLPRTSLLRRRASGSESESQLLAANVDVVLAVAALDRSLSARRLERVLVVARDAPATPVIVLTKADLCADVPAAVALARSVALDAAIVCVGAGDQAGLEAIIASIPVGSTAVLLGMSGAGKSTLTNRLLHREHMLVGGVRAADDRGRHTTSHREIVSTPWGAFLIDGPGIREIGLVDEGGLDDAFADVAAVAAQCRFSDCAHADEPGCALRAALESKALPAARVLAYTKLAREAAFARSQENPTDRRERKARERALTNAAWTATRSKRRV